MSTVPLPSNTTILVVDDQAVNREFLTTLLGYRGYRVLEAPDGVKGLAVARAYRPDLIISDILMPGIDGYEFVRRLRNEEAIAQTRVVFYTAIYRSDQARALAESLGVARLLIKPSEPEDILAAVEAVLSSPAGPLAPAQTEFDREHTRLLTDKLYAKVKELEKSNASLRLSEIQYRSLFDQNPLPMWILDDETYMFLAVNDAAVKHYGYSREEFLQMSVFEIRPPEDIAAARANLIAGRGQMLRKAGIWRHRIKDGTLIDVSILCQITTFDGKQARLVLAEDVTERQRAEEKLRESKEQLRELAARLQAVREQERTRVSRQLHDELGQALTALKMDCAWIANRLDGAHPSLIKRVQGSIGLVDETILAVRQLAAGLRPGILDLGLRAAVEWQAEEFQTRSDIACVVDASVPPGFLSAEQETEVFRIFQESLTNVARHAGASLVQVTLRQDPDGFRLEIADDGRGIRADEVAHRNSLGLLGMRERVALIGGTFAISGAPGNGTTVRVHVPVPSQKSAQPA